MKKVLCVDPGYSLARAKTLYDDKDYPGHLLYGVNHLGEYGIEAVVRQDTSQVNSRIKFERDTIKWVNGTAADAIYLSFIDWGVCVALLRKLGIIKIPIVALAHGYKKEILSSDNTASKIKKRIINVLRNFIYSGVDSLIFISEHAYREFLRENPNFKNRITYCPLQPEMIVKEADMHFTKTIISVGKTNRRYDEMLQFARDHKEYQVTIVDNTFNQNAKSANVQCIRSFVPFREVERMYEKNSIIAIPVSETGGGVFGLSSILDALSMCKPILASNTQGLGLDINKLELGHTYDIGSSKSFFEAVKYIETNYGEIVHNIEEFTKNYNINSFSKTVANELEKNI